MTKLTKTEQRALSAFRLLDRVAREDWEAADWAHPGEAAPAHFAHGFKSLRLAVDSARLGGPRVSELRLHDALQKLAAAGTIERQEWSGMGGRSVLYVDRRAS